MRKNKTKHPTDNLLSLADEPAREELRRLGWVDLKQAGGAVWLQPRTRDLYSEEETFAILEHLRRAER